MTKIRSFLTLLPLSLSLACGDPLKNAQLIEEPRVLAVQVESADSMATPEVGDEARVRVLVAGPLGPEPVRVAYRVCEAVDSARGIPICAGPAFADGTTEEASSAPTFDFVVEAGSEAGSRFSVLGVACASGEPSLAADPLDWSCGGNETPVRFSFDGFLGGSESSRHQNPDLRGLVVVLAGEEVPLTSPEDPPSCDEGALHVAPGEEHMLTLTLGSAAREDQEWLQLSHFSTSGKLARQYTVLEPEEEPRAVVEWNAPAEPLPIKQYLVVRDGRGGVAFASWDVCIQ